MPGTVGAGVAMTARSTFSGTAAMLGNAWMPSTVVCRRQRRRRWRIGWLPWWCCFRVFSHCFSASCGSGLWLLHWFTPPLRRARVCDETTCKASAKREAWAACCWRSRRWRRSPVAVALPLRPRCWRSSRIQQGTARTF